MQDKEQIEKVQTEVSHKSPSKAWTIAGTVFLCFVFSFLGAWLFLATGLVNPDFSRSINENRQNLVSQEGDLVAEVFEKVSPSTVAITTESVTPASRFFSEQVKEGAGSGVIISKDGYIMTNKHVVPEGVDKVTVVLHDGKEYTNVSVIGRDPANDIAFLKISGVNNLQAAKIGDSSKVKPGQQVVAIGNALGSFRNSVSAGIISGVGRPIQAVDHQGSAENLENLLQTDAAINPGNSGGPLVNLNGEVIGVNTAISEGAQAIGFAIPINDVSGVIKSILKEGKIVKPYIGLRYITITDSVAEELKLDVKEGALLISGAGEPAVQPNSPAARAGLQEDDIILKVNDQRVGQGSLSSLLAAYAPGDKVELTVLRGSQEITKTVTLGEFPL